MGQPEKRRNLGRGLSALIPPKPSEQQSSAVQPDGRAGLTYLPVDQVLPSDAQPRQVFEEAALDELAASIKRHGVLQPIVVRARGPQQFEIIAGERRWRAAQKAGLAEIAAVISDIAEQDTLTVALVENVQRRDLNAMEEAEAYQRLHRELGYSQAEIAEAVGKERSTVANSLRLLKLPAKVRDQVLDSELTMGHARALLALEDETRIVAMARQVVEQGWSVRQTELKVAHQKEARSGEGSQKKARPRGAETEAERDVRLRLQRALGTRVDLRHKNGKGALTVHFGSYDELDRLLAKLDA